MRRRAAIRSARPDHETATSTRVDRRPRARDEVDEPAAREVRARERPEEREPGCDGHARDRRRDELPAARWPPDARQQGEHGHHDQREERRPEQERHVGEETDQARRQCRDSAARARRRPSGEGRQSRQHHRPGWIEDLPDDAPSGVRLGGWLPCASHAPPGLPREQREREGGARSERDRATRSRMGPGRTTSARAARPDRRRSRARRAWGPRDLRRRPHRAACRPRILVHCATCADTSAMRHGTRARRSPRHRRLRRA